MCAGLTVQTPHMELVKCGKFCCATLTFSSCDIHKLLNFVSPYYHKTYALTLHNDNLPTVTFTQQSVFKFPYVQPHLQPQLRAALAYLCRPKRTTLHILSTVSNVPISPHSEDQI